ncbi:MAG: hypothetical protein QOK06_2667 [Acidimicrobiaceae bacterium]|jgi:hypothetical protein
MALHLPGGRGPGLLVGAVLTLAIGVSTPAAAVTVRRISLGPNGGNGANDVTLERATPDLSKVACSTAEQLTADDTDDTFDLYFCAGDATERLSTGPTGGQLNGGNETGGLPVHYEGVEVSNDGSHVYFVSDESLTANDTDHTNNGGPSAFPYGYADVYLRTGGTTTLQSTGPFDPNNTTTATGIQAASDGSGVMWFGGHFDNPTAPPFNNIYRRQGPNLDRVATSSSGSPDDVRIGASDLSAVIFQSADPFTSDDTDTSQDLYRWDGSYTLLTGVLMQNLGVFSLQYVATNANRALFLTDAALVPGDADSATDLYATNQNGVLTLLSTGPSGGNNNLFPVLYAGASTDATHAFFCTDEPLVPADTNTTRDEYEAFNGTTTLVSADNGGNGGPTGDACSQDNQDAADDRGAVSVAGDHAVFETDRRLTAQDTDNNLDIYERAGGVTTLVSTGPSGGNGASDARWLGESDDGTIVYFSTAEKLVGEDTDAAVDVYARIGGTTTMLVTPAPAAGPSTGTDVTYVNHANFVAKRPISSDGNSVIVSTKERLTADDTDSSTDLYKVTLGETPSNPPPDNNPPPDTTPTTPAPPVTPPAHLAALPPFSQFVTFPSTRRCASRRVFRIRVRIPKGFKATSVTVLVNGRKVATHRGKRITAPVNLRGLRKGRFRVKVTILLADGRRVSDSRRYITCAGAKH